MSLLDRLDSILPRWMVQAPREAMASLMSGPAMLWDGITEMVFQARFAAMPGQVFKPGVPGLGDFDSVDALPYIARDRLVYPGLTEQPWDLAARLRRYEDDWSRAGTAFGIMNELAAVMMPTPPLMRIVTSGGMWYTREIDGTVRFMTPAGAGFFLQPDGTSAPDATAAHAWVWDASSVPVPPDQDDGSRAWLIIYPPAGSPYLTMDDGTGNDNGTAGDTWNDPDANVEDGTPLPGIDVPTAGTCGTNSPFMFVELLRGVIQQRGAAGFRMAWIVIAFDPASFAPDGSSSAPPEGTAYPDGHWAWHTKYDAGTNSQITARNSTAEYWPGNPGGALPYQG